MHVSNCWLWAKLEYRRRKRAWKRAGMPAGEEPYYLKRPSRSSPRGIDHRFVGAYDKWNDQVRVTSFKPAHPKDVSWWLGWKHFLFHGRVEHGDWPRTVPADDEDSDGTTEDRRDYPGSDRRAQAAGRGRHEQVGREGAGRQRLHGGRTRQEPHAPAARQDQDAGDVHRSPTGVR